MRHSIVQFFSTPQVILVALFLLLHVPVMTYNLGFRDEGFFSYAAVRISHGEVPYRDFFLTTTPGMYYILGFFFTIFGPHIVIGKLLYTLTAALLLIIFVKTFPFANKFVRYTVWGVIIYVLGAPVGTVASYDTYGVFFLLLTGYTYLQAKKHTNPSWYALLGVVAVLTFVMKQSIGMLTIAGFGILILFFTKEKIRFFAWYVLGAAGMFTLFWGYFFAAGALWQSIYHIFFFAQTVKAHGQGFVIHRMLFLSAFVCFLLIFRVSPKRIRIGMIALGSLAVAGYLISSPQKIGRLWTYVFDPVFYVMSLGFGLGLLLLSFVVLVKKKLVQKDVYVCSAAMLVIITIAIGGSGFSKAFASITSPFFIPVVAYTFEAAGLVVKKRANIIQLLAIPILLVYLWYLFPTFPFSTKKLTAPVVVSEKHGLPAAKYLVIEEAQVKDLQKLIMYLDRHVSKSEKILCFPYCPMLHVLTNRESASYYSFFYPEVFMNTSQHTVISEMKKANTRYVVVQKSGSIEPEATQENTRLSILRGYIVKTYLPVYETAQFMVMKKK